MRNASTNHYPTTTINCLWYEKNVPGILSRKICILLSKQKVSIIYYFTSKNVKLSLHYTAASAVHVTINKSY